MQTRSRRYATVSDAEHAPLGLVGAVPVYGVDHAARVTEARYQLRINGYRYVSDGRGERWERGHYVARTHGTADALYVAIYRA